MGEIWKECGYGYSVSNKGNVRGKNGAIMKLRADTRKRGYKYVNMFYDGKHHSTQVHRLVAKSFIPNPNASPIINHKDENPSNNNVSNLEWCTYSYNLKYGNKRKRENATKIIKKTKNAPKAILMFDANGNLMGEFESAWAAAKNINGVSSHILDICNQKTHKDGRGNYYRPHTHKGYTFKFKSVIKN